MSDPVSVDRLPKKGTQGQGHVLHRGPCLAGSGLGGQGWGQRWELGWGCSQLPRKSEPLFWAGIRTPSGRERRVFSSWHRFGLATALALGTGQTWACSVKRRPSGNLLLIPSRQSCCSRARGPHFCRSSPEPPGPTPCPPRPPGRPITALGQVPVVCIDSKWPGRTPAQPTWPSLQYLWWLNLWVTVTTCGCPESAWFLSVSVRVFPAETHRSQWTNLPTARRPPYDWTASTVPALDRGRQRKEEFVLFPPHYLSSLHLTTSRPVCSCPWTGVCTIRSPGLQTSGLRLSHTTDSTGLQHAESRHLLPKGLLSLHKSS